MTEVLAWIAHLATLTAASATLITAIASFRRQGAMHNDIKNGQKNGGSEGS